MMVVLMHSPVPSGQGSGIFLSTLSYLTMPCIGIFFSISGALLLPVSNVIIAFIIANAFWGASKWFRFMLDIAAK